MKINYKSDFDFFLTLVDSEGADIGFPTFDFSVRLSTPGAFKSFTASCIGGVCSGCINDDGRLHVICKDHGLSVGTLRVEFSASLPNAIYPQSLQRVVSPMPVGIELVKGEGDYPYSPIVEMPMSVILRTAYDLAVAQGYTGTAEEYMSATLALVQTVEEVRATLADSQEAARIASEAAADAQRLTTDAVGAVESAQAAAERADAAYSAAVAATGKHY